MRTATEPEQDRDGALCMQPGKTAVCISRGIRPGIHRRFLFLPGSGAMILQEQAGTRPVGHLRLGRHSAGAESTIIAEQNRHLTRPHWNVASRVAALDGLNPCCSRKPLSAITSACAAEIGMAIRPTTTRSIGGLG